MAIQERAGEAVLLAVAFDVRVVGSDGGTDLTVVVEVGGWRSPLAVIAPWYSLCLLSVTLDRYAEPPVHRYDLHRIPEAGDDSGSPVPNRI